MDLAPAGLNEVNPIYFTVGLVEALMCSVTLLEAERIYRFFGHRTFFWEKHLLSSRVLLLSPKELGDPTLYTLPPSFSYDIPAAAVLGSYPTATFSIISTPNSFSFCSGLSTLLPSPGALDLSYDPVPQ